jgi:hypothetical protein
LDNIGLLVETRSGEPVELGPVFATILLMAYRSAKHEATNQTPDLELGRPPDAHQTIPTESDYVGKLRERIEDVHNYARECIDLASKRMRRHYNMRENTPQYAISRKVWLYDPSKKKGRCP